MSVERQLDREVLQRISTIPGRELNPIQTRRLKLEAKLCLAELEAAEAERDRLRELLAECANDIAETVEAEYPEDARHHPVMQRRYDRDMDVVRRARRALDGEE